MNDETYRKIGTACIAAAILCVLVAVGAPAFVMSQLGLSGHGAATQITSTDASVASKPVKKDEKTRKAIAAAPGTYGEKTGEHSHAELLPGVRWNPCAPVEFVLNTDNAPPGAVADFKVALRKTSQASGLKLKMVGFTDVVDRNWQHTPGRPVLVNWGRPGHGVLSRGASGTATFATTVNSSGREVITGGQITFNIDDDDYYGAGVFGTYGSRIVLYMHEVGHILGLDHVDDPNQLMFESVSMARDFGAGDLAGLKKVGSGPCIDVD